LGNIGDGYNGTRHNIGKDTVLKLSKLLKAPLDIDSGDCMHSRPITIAELPQELLESICLGSNLPKIEKEQKIKENNNLHNKNHQPTTTTITTTTTTTTTAQQATFSTSITNDNNISSSSEPSSDESNTTNTEQTTQTTTHNSPQNPSHNSHKIQKCQHNKNHKSKQPQFIPFDAIPSTIQITLAYPKSFMNVSGRPVHRLLQQLKLQPQNLVLLHDDLEVKTGQIKLKNSGSHGGQNGIRDVLDVLGHNSPFIRVRMGIGRPIGGSGDVSGFVLGKFGPTEREKMGFFDKFTLSSIAQGILYDIGFASQNVQNFYHSYQLVINPPVPKAVVKKKVEGGIGNDKKSVNSDTTPPVKSKIDIMSMFGM
jgi:PTH1 family peptidyl-tRNA hydrolase